MSLEGQKLVVSRIYNSICLFFRQSSNSMQPGGFFTCHVVKYNQRLTEYLSVKPKTLSHPRLFFRMRQLLLSKARSLSNLVTSQTYVVCSNHPLRQTRSQMNLIQTLFANSIPMIRPGQVQIGEAALEDLAAERLGFAVDGKGYG